MISEDELRERYPEIAWDEPVQVHVFGTPPGRWVCRYCIAKHGLVAADLDVTPFAYDTRLQVLDHIERLHPR